MSNITNQTFLEFIKTQQNDLFTNPISIDGNNTVEAFETSIFDRLGNKTAANYLQLLYILDENNDGNISESEYNKEIDYFGSEKIFKKPTYYLENDAVAYNDVAYNHSDIPKPNNTPLLIQLDLNIDGSLNDQELLIGYAFSQIDGKKGFSQTEKDELNKFLQDPKNTIKPNSTTEDFKTLALSALEYVQDIPNPQEFTIPPLKPSYPDPYTVEPINHHIQIHTL